MTDGKTHKMLVVTSRTQPIDPRRDAVREAVDMLVDRLLQDFPPNSVVTVMVSDGEESDLASSVMDLGKLSRIFERHSKMLSAQNKRMKKMGELDANSQVH
jgi:hypothetical protein